MTSLLSAPARPTRPAADPRHRRPLVPGRGPRRGRRGGAPAGRLPRRSASPAGSSPTPAPTAQPRDALRVGALAWLMAHGSGVAVAGVTVTAVPLLLTLVAALAWSGGSATGSATRSRATAPTPTRSPTASATGPSRSRVACFALGYVARHRSSPPRLAGTPRDRAVAPPRAGLVAAAGGAGRRPGDRGRQRAGRDLDGVVPGNLRATAAASLRRDRAAPARRRWSRFVAALASTSAPPPTCSPGCGSRAARPRSSSGCRCCVLPNADALRRLLPARPRASRSARRRWSRRPWS